jgi:hypothetical protein
MLLLAEDLQGATRELTPEELHAYFDATRAEWNVSGRTHFVHVYGARRESLSAVRDQLENWHRDGAPPFGDPFPTSRDVTLSDAEIRLSLGEPFQADLAAAPIDEWVGPVASRLGWHWVRVIQRGAARPAAFDEVADQVRLAAAVARRHEAVQHFLRSTFERYRIELDGRRIPSPEPVRELADPPTSSGED